MNWNRLYRPTRISDLHLKTVREELSAMLKSGKIPQALLFAGPKGTGKTTAARILAAILNDKKNEKIVSAQYYQQKKPIENICLADIEEINQQQTNILTGNSFLVRELDAASNRGIDDIRRLKEAIFTPPPTGMISVYILDEAHMLTTEAWNAFLKLLEEPPQHALFILATTELQKIPATIRSRCCEIFFSQANKEEISAALKQVAKKEKLVLQPDMIMKISEAAGGSFRDGIKLLEQVASQKTRNRDDAIAILGKQTSADYIELIKHILAKNPQHILYFFDQLRKNNTDEQAFLKGFLNFLHDQLIATYSKNCSTVASETVLRYLLTQLQKISPSTHSPLPHLELEIILLNMIAKSNTKSGSPAENQPKKITSRPITNKKTSTSRNQETPMKKQALKPSGNAQKVCEHWEEILATCSKQNFGLATLLRSAKAISLAESSLEIQVYYEFHKEQLLQPKFYTALRKIIEQVSGGTLLLSVATANTTSDTASVEINQTSLKQLAVDALM